MAADEKRKTSARSPRQSVPTDAAAGDATVGNALRSVYEGTVSEAIPDDLLDLLGKLS